MSDFPRFEFTRSSGYPHPRSYVWSPYAVLLCAAEFDPLGLVLFWMTPYILYENNDPQDVVGAADPEIQVFGWTFGERQGFDAPANVFVCPGTELAYFA